MRAFAVITAVGAALGLATSTGAATSNTTTIKFTSVVTKNVNPQTQDGGPKLDFFRSGKRVGHTPNHLKCQGTIDAIVCRGGPIKIKGVPKFDISGLSWFIPLCTDARKGCPEGDKKATGEMTTTKGPELQRKVIGHITFRTTAKGFFKKGHHIKTKIVMP